MYTLIVRGCLYTLAAVCTPQLLVGGCIYTLIVDGMYIDLNCWWGVYRPELLVGCVYTSAAGGVYTHLNCCWVGVYTPQLLTGCIYTSGWLAGDLLALVFSGSPSLEGVNAMSVKRKETAVFYDHLSRFFSSLQSVFSLPISFFFSFFFL